MSCFKLSEGSCDAIERMLAKFWWGPSEEGRKIHWLSWERLGTSKSSGGMGFRAFSEFNKALLGKQCWRLINEGDSLMSKVFKCRYFPSSGFLEAKVGFQPSYAWRSLLHAKSVISLGARWLIGNGQKVNIRKDSWIPEHVGFKAISTADHIPPDATVAYLIDVDSKQWNRELVLNSFSAFEANRILKIPISLRLPADTLTWHWETNGVYSVRSAHHLLCEEKSRNSPETSNNTNQCLWKKIWKIPLPNCVKNFLWRLGRNILPTRSNLRKKGMHLDTTCPLCHSDIESQDHLFMHCPMSKLVWFSSHLGLHILINLHLHDWLLQWLSSTDLLAQQYFGTTLWKIWKFRNQVIFKATKFEPIQVACDAVNFVTEYNNSCPKNQQRTIPHGESNWIPPCAGLIKLNVDAGCFSNGSTGWGMIARDCTGLVLFAATKMEHISVSPLCAEALGLRWCLLWAKNHNFEGIIVESDAEMVVKCLYGQSMIADINLVVSDCLELLSEMPNARVVHVKRNCNVVAHCLVGVAKNLGSKEWEGSVPHQVYVPYCNDLVLI